METKNPRFCSKSCSAKYNNALRGVDRKCKYCSDLLPRGSKNRKYCDYSCHKMHTNDVAVQSGKAGKKALKTYLIRKHENKCNCCSITEWNGKAIVMQLEHIDGNSDNNSLDNLELLCPNCHSQTDTFAGKNIGNGGSRSKRRMELYYEGKVY